MAKGDQFGGSQIGASMPPPPQIPGAMKTYNQFPSAPQQNPPGVGGQFGGMGGGVPPEVFMNIIGGMDQPLPSSQIAGMGSTYGTLPGTPQQNSPYQAAPQTTAGQGIKSKIGQAIKKTRGAIQSPTGQRIKGGMDKANERMSAQPSPIQSTGEFYRNRPLANSGLNMPDMDMIQLNRFLRGQQGY